MRYQVLVVIGDHQKLRETLIGLGGLSHIQLSGSSNVAEACHYIEAQPPDVLLVHLGMTPDWPDLLDKARVYAPHIPVIGMADYALDADQIEDYPQLRFLESVPIDKLRKILLSQISTCIPSGLGPFQLSDYLQLATMGQLSLRIQVETESERTGDILVFQGKLWDAHIEHLSGLEALIDMLDDNVFRMEYQPLLLPEGECRIQKSLSTILLEIATETDERMRNYTEGLETVPSNGSRSKKKPKRNGKPQPAQTHSDDECHEEINRLCGSLIEDMPGALALGLIHLPTGQIVGGHHVVPGVTNFFLESMALTGVTIFQGSIAAMVNKLDTLTVNPSLLNPFEEVFISSKEAFHFMKLIEKRLILAVMITKKTFSMGMGWACLRDAVESLDRFFEGPDFKKFEPPGGTLPQLGFNLGNTD